MITTTIQHQCRKCGSMHIVKNGHNRSGSQQYRRKDCGAIGVFTPKHADSPERQEESLRASLERPSMRGISRIFGVSRKALAAWIKKNSRRCPLCARPFVPPNQTTSWNVMTSGHSSENGHGNAGCGRWNAGGRVPARRVQMYMLKYTKWSAGCRAEARPTAVCLSG